MGGPSYDASHAASQSAWARSPSEAPSVTARVLADRAPYTSQNVPGAMADAAWIRVIPDLC
eukprot:13207489-Alexandrium_andersonii.AAC.1